MQRDYWKLEGIRKFYFGGGVVLLLLLPITEMELVKRLPILLSFSGTLRLLLATQEYPFTALPYVFLEIIESCA